MKIRFCDCSCKSCDCQAGSHESCWFECEEVVPKPPDRRKVLGGRPGREIIRIE